MAFLLGPPLLGLVAQRFGIRWSFGIGVPLLLLSFVAAAALRPAPAVKVGVSEPVRSR